MDVDTASVAAVIADPARAAMLDALLAGEALTAGELARAASIAPSTASEHLRRLRDAGLVNVYSAGRHRYTGWPVPTLPGHSRRWPGSHHDVRHRPTPCTGSEPTPR